MGWSEDQERPEAICTLLGWAGLLIGHRHCHRYLATDIAIATVTLIAMDIVAAIFAAICIVTA